MPKLCDAKIGNTVILKGVVHRIEPGHSMYIQFPNNMYDKHLPSFTVVESIITPPWEPKVGDLVRKSSATWDGWAVEVLAVGEVYLFVKYVRIPSDSASTYLGTETLLKKENMISAD